ncbi:MAG: TetR/AcrR family transcriptional regulator [Thermocrispum sp.]
MARSTPGVTRQRIVDEAVRLFAANGYDATSVADIQTACGLAAGSGALYKHFPSKKALLEEIVKQHVELIATGRRDVEPAIPDDPRAAVELIGRAIWAAMESDRDPIRIIFRELDRYPDLMDQMWRGLLGGLYRTAAGWIRAGVRRGQLDVADPDATAAVLLGSLTYYRIMHACVGHTPGDVAEEAYLTAWIDHAVSTLRVHR